MTNVYNLFTCWSKFERYVKKFKYWEIIQTVNMCTKYITFSQQSHFFKTEKNGAHSKVKDRKKCMSEQKCKMMGMRTLI